MTVYEVIDNESACLYNNRFSIVSVLACTNLSDQFSRLERMDLSRFYFVDHQ